MKVLHVLNELLPSGAEVMLHSAYPYWDKKYEMHILSTTPSIGVYAAELNNVGYSVHHIYDKNPICLIWKFVIFVRKNKFDVVHIHREGMSLYFEIAALFGGAKRVVSTVHNVFTFHGLLKIRRIATRHLGKLLGTKVVTISESVYLNEKSNFGIESVIVNNWYDENRFSYTDDKIKKIARQQLGIQEDSFCIVSVGNCSHVKNHMSILKAITELKDYPVVYLHIGKGEMEQEEQEYVVANHIENKVRFEGHTDPLIYLQASDLFIMPSVYEGVGISALEAMATGMRCLLTDVPGLKDFKKLKLDNVVYSNLDDNDILKCLKKEIKHTSGTSEVQAKLIRKFYGIQQGVDGYQKIYSEDLKI